MTTRGNGTPDESGPAPGGSSDTSAPTVNAVNLTGYDYCHDVAVSTSVADNVGVTSATVSWNGAPGSGSTAMSGGGTSWSASIPGGSGFVNPGTLTVTVTARDAAGNTSSRSSSVELVLC